MDDFIKRLPIDIVLRIIPYTYNLQDKKLMNDIINNYENKITIFKLYHENYFDPTEDIIEEKYWIINNLSFFSNNYQGSMYGYVDKFYNIFKRLFILKTEQDIDNYILLLYKKNINSQINIFIGLLNDKERQEFINFI